jgi:hypothetical protein
MKRVNCLLHIRNGEIVNKSTIRDLFNKIKEVDGRGELTYTPFKKRSLPQNAFMHGVLIPEFRRALNSVGYSEVKTDEQAKLIMKSMFLRSTITNELTGEVVEYIKDTHSLTREEMAALYDEVIQFCAENMSYVIPYPNEILTINF